MKILPTLLALLVISCAQPSHAQPLSPAAFRDAVATEIAKKHPDLCVEKPDAYTIQIGRAGEACNEAVVSISYIYKQYLDDPNHLQTYVSSLTDLALTGVETIRQESFHPDRSRVVAVIRPAAYAAYLRAGNGATGGIWRPFIGDLIAVLVQKDAEKSRSLTDAELKELHLTAPQAWELAARNLRDQIGPLERSANNQGAEVIAAGSGLATSHLWLPEACTPSGPDFDAFVVARDTYFYADQRTATATSMLASYAAQLVKSGDETYSDTLISCIDGRWYASVFDGNSTWKPASEGAR